MCDVGRDGESILQGFTLVKESMYQCGTRLRTLKVKACRLCTATAYCLCRSSTDVLPFIDAHPRARTL